MHRMQIYKKKLTYLYFFVLLHQIFQFMNLLDLIMAIPLGFFIWKGYKKGAIFEIATLAGLMGGTYIAIHFSCRVAQLIELQGEYAVLIAFFITFVAVVVLSFLFGKMIEGVVKLVRVGFLNNLLGAVFSMLQCVCILSVILYYINVIDSREALLTPTAKSESALYKPVNKMGNHLIWRLKNYVNTHHQTFSDDED